MRYWKQEMCEHRARISNYDALGIGCPKVEFLPFVLKKMKV